MSKKLKKVVSVTTSVTTVLWLSGIAMLAPMTAQAVDIVDGDLMKTADNNDVYIAKLVGDKKFKRLILNPDIFNQYGHLEWGNIKTVEQATIDEYTVSDLVRAIDDEPVYKLSSEAGADDGTKQWLNMTAAEFESEGYDWDSIYIINNFERDSYTAGSDVTAEAVDEEPPTDESTGTLTVTLADDTPAAGVAVENAARLPFTSVDLKATGGDVIVDQLVVERTGNVAQDAGITSLDVIDEDTNLPINTTSKTLNSLHTATFNKDFTVESGETKTITLAANMPSDLSSYAGEVPSLTLNSITLKGDATLDATLPITGNGMTLNYTITIGTATIQRGAYTNASTTSSAPTPVGKEDYTYFSFQVAAGTNEKVTFSQVKVYQEGSAALGSDLVNLELLQDGTKLADGIVDTTKYVIFSFDALTLNKGQTAQFQIRGKVEDGSGRTIILGIYRTTDLLVTGVDYGYNITPTYSGTGSSANNPVLSDNEFTIGNGTLQVTKSGEVGQDNIGVDDDQWLGAFLFTCKGEAIDISALTLTVTSTGSPGNASDAILMVELVDPNGTVVAGPTDPVRTTGVVSWTDTFTVPVGTTVYKVRGNLQTSADWASDDTVYVSFTPSAMTATGETTGNSISATPSSARSGNTQTVKAAALTVTRKSLPANSNIIVDQDDVVLSAWEFDASDSGEDIRITSLLWAGRGNAATNTNALTVYADGVADSQTNDALADSSDGAAATSTFSLGEPIIITKGETITIELHGDKDSVDSNADENWGLTDDGGASIIAYGVSTGNSVTETLTEDDGPTLTSQTKGTLTIETEGNPSSAILLAGSTSNIFTNVKLSAKYEDLRLDKLIVYIQDGGYGFSPGTNPAISTNYLDIANVAVYEGITKLPGAEGTIPSGGSRTFNLAADTLTIPKGGSKVLVLKADMATIDPDTDNSPGTNSADIKLGFGGANGIKTTGKSSNSEITTTTYETYRDATSSNMVLRSSKPIVTLPRNEAGERLGAAQELINGTLCVYAFKVTADASGGEVLLFRNSIMFATSGDVSLSDIRIRDEEGNKISTAAGALGETADTDHFNYDNDGNFFWTTTFNNPDFSVDDDTEAIKIPAGESKTFKVYATVANASTGENLSAYLVGDPTPNVAGHESGASSTLPVNENNFAVATATPILGANHGWRPPGGTYFGQNLAGDLASTTSAFIWSDNYKNKSYSGSGGNNATTAPMWYNGHLVPGLEDVVSTTPYTIGWSG